MFGAIYMGQAYFGQAYLGDITVTIGIPYTRKPMKVSVR